jgi:hypothetical protein
MIADLRAARYVACRPDTPAMGTQADGGEVERKRRVDAAARGGATLPRIVCSASTYAAIHPIARRILCLVGLVKGRYLDGGHSTAGRRNGRSRGDDLDGLSKVRPVGRAWREPGWISLTLNPPYKPYKPLTPL